MVVRTDWQSSAEAMLPRPSSRYRCLSASLHWYTSYFQRRLLTDRSVASGVMGAPSTCSSSCCCCLCSAYHWYSRVFLPTSIARCLTSCLCCQSSSEAGGISCLPGIGAACFSSLFVRLAGTWNPDDLRFRVPLWRGLPLRSQVSGSAPFSGVPMSSGSTGQNPINGTAVNVGMNSGASAFNRQTGCGVGRSRSAALDLGLGVPDNSPLASEC
mmetsp:Transcript_17431/g.39471  ORF Transcript_17431/g.39471 Transcript_17431/m.39471 type:complete len:213 (+) Transcript_17431:175-813(+)